VPPEALKAIATYAHGQRLRVQARVAVRPEEAEQCRSRFGRPALALLADAGLLDKRFTAVHGGHLTDDECRVLGTARAAVAVCTGAEQNLGWETAPVDKLLAAGAGIAFGSAGHSIELLKDGRALEYLLRRSQQKRPALATEAAKVLFHAATVTGARSIGATGGALEVGRPADFFTVGLYDPSIAGADPESLLANIVFALERRAIREVWIGARQRIVNGRHPDQGLIVGRFVEMQRRLWT
jgi:formimidoylglutamate deiminase